MRLHQRLSTLGVAVVLAAPLLAMAGGEPAAAAPEASVEHAVVSMNVVTSKYHPHADPRPQTWDASMNGNPSTQGVAVTWEGGRFMVSVTSLSDGPPVHLGLSGTPQLGQHNPDTELYGQAQLDDENFLNFDGQADFLDLVADASGHLTRFDVVYSYTEQRTVGAVFGEIRMNEPEQLPTLSPTAQHLVWPRVAPQDEAVLATDAFRNTSNAPLPLGAVDVIGSHRDFRLHDDTCSRQVLPVGGSCSITVAYRPTAGGPRVASLVVPTPTDQLSVDLSSEAPLGRSSLTTTGKEYIDRGKRTTFTPIVVYNQGDYGDHAFDHLYRFYPDERSPRMQASPKDEFALDLIKKHGTIKRGTHKTERDQREYGLDYHANTQYCNDLAGTMKVRHFVVDDDGQPTYAVVDFEQRCSRAHTYPTGTIHGRLRYQDRKDTTAPHRPTRLRLEDGRLRWKRSTSKDLATTIVRVDLGKRFKPTRGMAVSSGSAQSARLPRLHSGMTYTVAAFSVDKTGNVSRPAELTLKT